MENKSVELDSRKQELIDMLKDYDVSLSVDDVAKILSICNTTAKELLKSGKIKSFQLNESTQRQMIRTTKVDLINYMVSGSAQ
jgi:predicted ArsR family transcriptional regulator